MERLSIIHVSEGEADILKMDVNVHPFGRKMGDSDEKDARLGPLKPESCPPKIIQT